MILASYKGNAAEGMRVKVYCGTYEVSWTGWGYPQNAYMVTLRPSGRVQVEKSWRFGW